MHASDMAAVLGIDPYKTDHELALQKLGKLPQKTLINDSIVLGNLFEAPIGLAYARKTKKQITANNKTYFNRAHPFLAGTPDFTVFDERAVVDAKHVGSRMSKYWGYEADEIAPYMLPQMHTYNLILDLEYCDVAAVIGGYGPFVFHVERSAEWDKLILEKGGKFWDNLKKGIIPELDPNHPSSADLIKHISFSAEEPRVDLPDTILPVLASLDQYKVDAHHAKTMIDYCNILIAKYMRNAAIGIASDGTVITRKEVTRKAYEVKATSYINTTIRRPKD